ncbi:MAG TPA: hypothetical protein PK280_04265 [Planctomycetota bacterium]|nr:hypothetical protein [Planctomycetota bacterium]
MKPVRKVLWAALVLLAAAAAGAGWFLSTLDSRVESMIEATSGEYLGVPVEVQSVRVSLLDGRALLRGFGAGNPAGFATPRSFRAGELAASFELRSAFGDLVTVPEIRARGLEITVEGGPGGSNLAAIVKNARKVSAEKRRLWEATGEPPPRERLYRVGRIVAVDTTVRLSATFMGGREASCAIPKIELTDLPEEMTGGEILGQLVEAILRDSAKSPGRIGKLLGDLTVQAGIAMVERAVEGAGEAGKTALEGAGAAAREVGSGMGQAAKGVGAGLGEGIVGVSGGVGEVGSGMIRGAGGTAENVGKGIGGAVEHVGSGIGAVGGGVLKGAAGVVKGVGSGAVGAVETVSELFRPGTGEPSKPEEKGAKP